MMRLARRAGALALWPFVLAACPGSGSPTSASSAAVAPPSAGAAPLVLPEVATTVHLLLEGLVAPAGLVRMPEGLYVSDEATDRVWLQPLPAGAAVPIPGPESGLDGPSALAGDETGNLFVAERRGRRVVCRDPGGRWITVLGGGDVPPGEAPVRATDLALEDPGALAVDDAGSLWVLDAGWRMLVRRGADGRATAWSAPGSAPAALAAHADGSLLVLDPLTGVLYRGRPGSWSVAATGLSRAVGVLVHPRYPWVVLEAGGALLLGPDGERLEVAGSPRPVAGAWMDPLGWAVADAARGGVLLQQPRTGAR
ncbi:MAG: hypothetical protein VKO64_05870 [Candidatus Sericytochromatia bacterium]|nr:hypothetical protein [Candidatus Sericytochromatia bacterium]